MPEVTSDEACSGFSGLTVVFARRKETTPARQKKAPTRKQAAARLARSGIAAAMPGTLRASTHIASPNKAATSGGGMRFSSACMRASFGTG